MYIYVDKMYNVCATVYGSRGGGESLTSDSGLVVAVKGDFSDLQQIYL